MRLRTIWTLKGMQLPERLRRTREALTMSLAARLPKNVAYWAYIHQGQRYIKPDEVVPEVGFLELLSRMERD